MTPLWWKHCLKDGPIRWVSYMQLLVAYQQATGFQGTVRDGKLWREPNLQGTTLVPRTLRQRTKWFKAAGQKVKLSVPGSSVSAFLGLRPDMRRSSCGLGSTSRKECCAALRKGPAICHQLAQWLCSEFRPHRRAPCSGG